MVRNPVEAAHSMYHEQRFLGIEWIDSFEASLAAEKERQENPEMLKFGFPENLLYRNIYFYSKNIARFDAAFGSERVHIALLNDLKENPVREVKRICRILNLDVEPVSGFSFRIKNAAKRPRVRWVNRLAIFPPAWLKPFSAPFPRSFRLELRKRLAQLNTTPTSNLSLTPTTRTQLTREFAEDVHWLSQRIDRDLTHWLRLD